jgi:hypothetical protein
MKQHMGRLVSQQKDGQVHDQSTSTSATTYDENWFLPHQGDKEQVIILEP